MSRSSLDPALAVERLREVAQLSRLDAAGRRHAKVPMSAAAVVLRLRRSAALARLARRLSTATTAPA